MYVLDHFVHADNELRLGVPLVVCDVVARLKPNPLLALGQEPIIAGHAFAGLYHCKGRQKKKKSQG